MKKGKLLEDFKNSLKNKYLFHLHTNYTDGNSSVRDYCSFARMNNYTSVIFTEHVRKNLSYDFEAFYNEIIDARKEFEDLRIFLGVETKILSEGELDIPSEILSKTELICFSVHSFSESRKVLKKSLQVLFNDKKWKPFIRVWVHPSSYKKVSINTKTDNDELHRLIEFASENKVFIEYNLDYDCYNKSHFLDVAKENLIIGVNGHSVDDILFKIKKNEGIKV